MPYNQTKNVFIFLFKVTNNLLKQLEDSVLMEKLRDICLINCKVTSEGLKYLNWQQLENINIVGASIIGNFKACKLFTTNSLF